MMTYTVKEIKSAILKIIPVGTRIDRDEFENVKWQLILNDGFAKQGWLNEMAFFQALAELRNECYFERHRDHLTRKKYWVRFS